jgi:nitroimidazol reductase NimA-like FMN-containing flavoprotein (pyridoxamine 5'-phosphate oxidase superfamily)
METDRNGLEVLSREECLALLETVPVGRIVVTISALPVILPVHFSVVDGTVVIRTSPGTKLATATRNTVVAFEADSVDAQGEVGWSVAVTGTAASVSDPVERQALMRLPLPEWAGGADSHFIRITPVVVSGRRLPAGARLARSSAPA